MAELLKRDVTAGLAPRNAPAYDILATYEGKTALIRVKTKRETFDVWQWGINKDGDIFRNLLDKGDFTVLVHLAMDVRDVRFFVLPTGELNRMLTGLFDRWVTTPGKNGRIRDPKNKHRALSYKQCEEQLLPHENRWEIFWD